MAYLAVGDISTSIDKKNILGDRRFNFCTLAFGGKNYPFGGIPMPYPISLGMREEINDITFADDVYGIVWKYDKTNHKLKAFVRAPAVVFEETVTLTDNTTGYTKYPMAWPLYASNGNQALGLLPAGLTPVTTTIAINMYSATPGQRALITAKATDTYSTITISYITQAWREVFDNLVEAEVMTSGATTTNGITFTAGTPDVISFDAVGTGFVVGLMVATVLSSTVAAPKPLQKGQTAAAAEYALDWTNTSPAGTTLKPLQTQVWDDSGNKVYFNYIKDPGVGFLHDRFIEEDSAASSSQVYTHAAAAALVKQALLWGTPGWMPSVTVSTTSATWPIGGIGMTLGSTAQWQPTNFYPKAKAVTAGSWTSGTGAAASLTVKPSYIWGVPEDIPDLVLLEMPDNELIKSKTIRAMVWGR